MKTYAFDIEIFKNFFSVLFENVDNEANRHEFVVFEDRNDTPKLRKFLDASITLVGYNSLHFDNPILNAIVKENYSVRDGYDLAQNIINQVRYEEIIPLKWIKAKYKSIDLMSLLGLQTSLKRVAINLRHPKIQELPIAFDTEVTEDQVQQLLDYNWNDVAITKALYWAVEGEIKMRQELSEIYGIDLINASNSKIANVLLERFYAEQTRMRPDDFKQKRTPRDEIKVSDCLGPIVFTTDAMRNFLSDLSEEVVIVDKRFKFKKTNVTVAGKIFDVGVGGMHSRDESGVFVSDRKCFIVDVDVTSFYPNIMLVNRIKPEHLDNCFFDIYVDILNQRVRAKEAGERAKEQGLKITLNSTFGKMRNEHTWLYDPKAFLSVTMNGQLYLLMLIEQLSEAGFEILSANTDGLICRVKRKKKDKFIGVCEQWMKATRFDLEYKFYSLYIRKNCNNYIARTEEGHVKKKGLFETETPIQKGFSMPIIPKALEAYFLHGTKVDDFFARAHCIYDYLKTERSGKKFQVIFRQNGTEAVQQRVNRFYVAKRGGELLKRKGHKEIRFCAGELVELANDVVEEDVYWWDVNLDYYKRETRKIINSIEPIQQLKLF